MLNEIFIHKIAENILKNKIIADKAYYVEKLSKKRHSIHFKVFDADYYNNYNFEKEIEKYLNNELDIKNELFVDILKINDKMIKIQISI